MTSAATLLTVLQSAGIRLSRAGDQLKIKAEKKVSDEHLRLIKEHKAELLALVDAMSGQQNDGSLQQYGKEPERPVPHLSRESGEFYKQYSLPNGTTLQLTKEEFDRVVEAFRLKLEQDQRNNSASNRKAG